MSDGKCIIYCLLKTQRDKFHHNTYHKPVSPSKRLRSLTFLTDCGFIKAKFKLQIMLKILNNASQTHTHAIHKITQRSHNKHRRSYDLDYWKIGIWSPVGAEAFPLSTASKPAVGPTRRVSDGYRLAYSLGKAART